MTPDHEDKESYSFTVVAEAGGLSSEKTVTIAVTDLNDEAPVISSPDTGTALAENTEVAATTVIYTATATPDVADGVAWFLKSDNDDDAGLFDINRMTGV